MSRIDDLMSAAIRSVPDKPADTASRELKKNWNEALSNAFALAIADELRHRGLATARPFNTSDLQPSGRERRIAGGIGAKKVDVTWATEESGLLLACSVKTIMFRDGKSKNFQKNLTNRRGDLLIEAVTLHRRFPYAVLAGFLFVDHQAEHDQTTRRKSTFQNAFPRLRLFTRRPDPSGRDEQYERLYLLLVDSDRSAPRLRAFEVNDSQTEVSLDFVLSDLIGLLGERNFDHYDGTDGRIRAIGR